MLLADVVATSGVVARTRSRLAKVDALASTLRQARGAGDRRDITLAVTYLAGQLPQRRTGVGPSALRSLPPAAGATRWTIGQVDDQIEAIADESGPGSRDRRAERLRALFAGCTESEQIWLRSVMTGSVRQGALDSVLVDAAAQVSETSPALVRRAAMLSGSSLLAAATALAEGTEALAAIGLEVGRPLLPMLASSEPTVAAAMAGIDDGVDGGVLVDAKLDGIRLQAHRRDGEVRLWTRSLEEITSRLPAVVDQVGRYPGGDLVLDGEALLLDESGRPRPFQETSSSTARRGGVPADVNARFFDLLHRDGADLLDLPARERLAQLDSVIPAGDRVAHVITGSAQEAETFTARVLAEGHEGVVVKDLGAPYAAGRRGAAWIKVKPVHTLDLVVIAVERGNGRRSGWLSNIHLAARAGTAGEFVMVGKTFKGMTDEMLAWQTARFRELQTADDGYTVQVRGEQVVEVAIDGVQRSTRYPGGVALRFARVVRYRDDKTPEQADTIDNVTSLLP